jgi:hypothetical protein
VFMFGVSWKAVPGGCCTGSRRKGIGQSGIGQAPECKKVL